MGELHGGAAVTSSIYNLVRRLEVFVHLDTFVDIKFDASFFKSHTLDIRLPTDSKQDCLYLYDYFRALVIDCNLDLWVLLLIFCLTHFLELLWDSTK